MASDIQIAIISAAVGAGGAFLVGELRRWLNNRRQIKNLRGAIYVEANNLHLLDDFTAKNPPEPPGHDFLSVDVIESNLDQIPKMNAGEVGPIVDYYIRMRNAERWHHRILDQYYGNEDMDVETVSKFEDYIESLKEYRDNLQRKLRRHMTPKQKRELESSSLDAEQHR